MSTRLFIPHTKVVRYLPCLRTLVNSFRELSSYDDRTLSEVYTSDSYHSTDIQGTVWPDTKLGPLSPKDKRFIMPGLVGPESWNCTQSFKSPNLSVNVEDVLQKLERKGENIFQYIDPVDIERNFYAKELSPSEKLECVAHSCPTLLRKDFSKLFPTRNIMEGNFTVITVSQQTENDMATWNQNVSNERKQLLASFINGAQEICQALNEAGYWADFIDPSSGKPYFEKVTMDSLLETDDRYLKLGFELEDLGCCRVITHHKWGTHSYVSCLFTDAPLTLTVLQPMLKSSKSNTQ